MTLARWCARMASGLLVGTVVLTADPTSLRAQSSATPFELRDALRLVRTSHPIMAAAGGRRRSVSGAARQDAALLNPQFEWRRENLGSPLLPDEFATAALPVDLYGRRAALRAASRSVASRALADSVTTARHVEFDVARAYWRTALAYALHEAASAQRASMDTIAGIEERRARDGAVSQGSALRARLEADRARLSEASARAEVELARGDLARALALPIDSVRRPTAHIRIDSLPPSLDAGALQALARARRPELVAAQARVAEAQKKVLAEKLGALPAIGITGGSKRTSGLQTGVVAIGFALPLLDRNGGNRERAQGDLLTAQSDLRSAHATIDADVIAAHRAYTALSTEFARVVAGAPGSDQRDLAARGATVATIAATAYREGAIALFELLDTERLRADVRSAAVRAAVQVRLAHLDIVRAIGLAADDPLLTLPTP
jgi:outer membrane protein, heavy metal efflux system